MKFIATLKFFLRGFKSLLEDSEKTTPEKKICDNCNWQQIDARCIPFHHCIDFSQWVEQTEIN